MLKFNRFRTVKGRLGWYLLVEDIHANGQFRTAAGPLLSRKTCREKAAEWKSYDEINIRLTLPPAVILESRSSEVKFLSLK